MTKVANSELPVPLYISIGEKRDLIGMFMLQLQILGYWSLLRIGVYAEHNKPYNKPQQPYK